MATATLGNYIAAARTGSRIDVYCCTSPTTIAVFTQSNSSGINEFEVKGTPFNVNTMSRDTKIAVNRRDFSNNSQQASVFYQIADGSLYEQRINNLGQSSSYYMVSGVPTGTPTTPVDALPPTMMGTSLATATIGADNQTAFLFYQAADNRIYYNVQQLAAGSYTWGIPSAVTSEPTETPTTLSAFSYSWAGTENGESFIVDCVCVAYIQSPGRFKVYRLSQLRRPSTSPRITINQRFEPVLDYSGPSTREPFSGVHVASVDGTTGHCPVSAVETFRFFTQLLPGPAQIWEGELSPKTGFLDYTVVVSNTSKLKIPMRGTSIATLYDPPKTTSDQKTKSGSVTIIYTSPEGLLVSKTVIINPPPN